MIEERQWLTGTGTIIYDPPRDGMKRRTEWWAIVKIDREITRYYRRWVEKEKWLQLNPPSWDAHISIIRGEKPKPELIHLWKKYHGMQVEFQYSPYVKLTPSGKFWIVDARADLFTKIRDEFELPSNWRQHITVAKMKWVD